MARTVTRFAAWLLISASCLPALSTAQDSDLDLRRLPWDIFAETMNFDGKTSTYIYTGVQFSQGNISIRADEGRATRQEGEDSAWLFAGNVVIDVGDGHIQCDSARLEFDGSALRIAEVSGSPATFSMRRAGSDDTTDAAAGKLVYDVVNGIIEFSDDATITESGNRISSHYLVYNILERRINADSSGNGNDRVRITYTPTDGTLPDGVDASDLPTADESNETP